MNNENEDHVVSNIGEVQSYKVDIDQKPLMSG